MRKFSMAVAVVALIATSSPVFAAKAGSGRPGKNSQDAQQSDGNSKPAPAKPRVRKGNSFFALPLLGLAAAGGAAAAAGGGSSNPNSP